MTDPLGKHLVLVGGGHAHMTVMLNLNDFIQKGHRVTLISTSQFHYYSGMGPGMLGGTYRPNQIRFHVEKMVEDRGGDFIEGEVVRIDPVNKKLILSSQDEVTYDVVSFNTGSHVPVETIDGVNSQMFPVKPIVSLLQGQQSIIKLIKSSVPNILVVGGGPAGLEMAGNIWKLVRDKKGKANITLFAGRNFLSPYPEKVRRLALKSLSSREIEIVEGSRVKRFDQEKATLENGESFPYDLVFLALGVRPSPLFRNSGISTGEDGGLLVNRFLQSVDHPEIFGGGDCISFQDQPLDKVGVYAVRQNPILHHNLISNLEDGEMKIFEPQKTYLLIFNLGNGKGIFWKENRVWNGRLPFYLKDYIDKKFMRSFQVSGERSQ